MDESIRTRIDEFLRVIMGFEDAERVRFIILYGSALRGEGWSDIDLAVYYDGTPDEAADFRLRVLCEVDEIFDVQIFQQLPLYVRIQVLRGEVVYCDSEGFLHDIAWETIKEFDDFKHRFYDYIGLAPMR
ncbi:nucleotidyltransferase domain-containing protein [Methanothermobacter sp.]|uniref:nucleotidyltransferase domain-containing protein n=1 Tax=Methanothermobacter sp. TaxID=1884223 RepID=UPI00261BBD88|nr:nucleotidyltransferase domain-containing protein [Methanothermobacter sp.]MDI9615072.1 nucleotidyltransferase domain-containing protein [Methanothermobacter sp.]